MKNFFGQLYGMPDDLLLDQVLANNKTISPTAHFAFDKPFRHYCTYIVGEWVVQNLTFDFSCS